MLHPNDAIPRRRLCRAFMKKFQIQRNSYGKSLISSFIRVLVGPQQTAANNRESNRKRTSRASCRLRWQPLLVPGAAEIPTWAGRGGRSRVLAKRNQNLSRPRWRWRAWNEPWNEPGTSPGAVLGLRYSGVTYFLR